VTVAPEFEPFVVRLPSYTLTPLATELPEALTMLTPLAPFSALPERVTLLLSLVVTVDLFAATAPALPPVSVCPAVTLSI
jgi:hypothetical protein